MPPTAFPAIREAPGIYPGFPLRDELDADDPSFILNIFLRVLFKTRPVFLPLQNERKMFALLYYSLFQLLLQ